MTSEQIKHWIMQGLPSSEVTVEGDGRHFEARVIASEFKGKNSMQRHRMVYQTLGNQMDSAIHALSIKTFTPDEVEK